MEEKTSVGENRAIYKEFLRLEKTHPKWMVCTYIGNRHICRLLKKVGALPFEYNRKEGKIWYKKG